MPNVLTYLARPLNVAMFALAILGGVLYFLLLPKAHTYRYADASEGYEQIEKKSLQRIAGLGYGHDQTAHYTTFTGNQDLIKKAHYALDRKSFDQHLKEMPSDRSTLYHWATGFHRDLLFGGENPEAQNESSDDELEFTLAGQNSLPTNGIRLIYSQQGEWMAMINYEQIVPRNLLRRSVIDAVYPELLTIIDRRAVSDSALVEQMSFHLGGGDLRVEVISEEPGRQQDDIHDRLKLKFLSDSLAIGYARYYLEHTHWADQNLTLDSLYLVDYGDYEAARLEFARPAALFNGELSLQVDVAPTGALLAMEPDYDLPEIANETGGALRNYGKAFAFIAAALVVIIVFIRRIRARVIDTKSTLVVALLVGALLPLVTVATFVKSLEAIRHMNLQGLLVITLISGITGGFSVISYFLLTSVGESITRQVWPSKLQTFDLIRRGYLVNRPVGFVLLRSSALAFITAGIFASLLFFLPETFIIEDDSSEIFIWSQSLIPWLSPLAYSLYLAFGFTVLSFLVVAPQVYTFSKRNWLAIGTAAIVITLLGFLPIDLHPISYEFGISLILGALLAFYYHQWGFSTTLLTATLFFILLKLDTTWIIPHSLDQELFYSAVTFIASIPVLGLLFVLQGKPETMLPSYIPEYVEDLAREERMEQELQIAKRVQDSFLPKDMPQFANLDIDALCDPAYETGGDYYDVIKLDEHRLAITIGDVSGKGIQAAFYMTLVKGIIHSLCKEIDSPVRLLQRANDLFCENSERGTFISMIYGIFDTRDQTFRFARAGHTPILYKNGGGNTVREIKPKGLGLGLIKGETFLEHLHEEQLSLKQGDTLVFFTDGLNEATASDGSFYGMERIVSYIQQHETDRAGELLHGLKEDILAFMNGEKQHDDLTLLVVQVGE